MAVSSDLWGPTELGRRVRPAARHVEGYRTFSTSGLTRDERVGLWERHNADALIGLRARTIDDSVLQARETVFRTGRLQLADVVASAHVVERSSAQIAQSDVDGVALYFALHGESFFYHEGGVQLQRPGTMLLCDVSRPFMRGFAHGLEELVVRIPRVVFETVAGRDVPGSPITLRFDEVPDGNDHAAALARLVRSTLEHPDPASPVDTEQRAFDLLHAMLHGAGSSRAYRRAALAYIDRRLTDRSLSVGAVARGIGISERHLARVFAETGTGVARRILERRLDLAFRLLSAPGCPAVSVVADRCGFASAPHFTRVFRERYESTPAEVRARSMA